MLIGNIVKCFSYPFSLQWQNKFCSAIKLPNSSSWGWWGGGICRCDKIISVRAKMPHEYIGESEKFTGWWVKWFLWLLRDRERCGGDNWGGCTARSCPWEWTGNTLDLFHLEKVTMSQGMKKLKMVPPFPSGLSVSSKLRCYLPGQLSLEEPHLSLGRLFFNNLGLGPWLWNSECGKANQQD